MQMPVTTRKLFYSRFILVLGKYCSVVGTLVKESGLPEVSAVKVTDLSRSPVFASMWHLEVEELKLLLIEQAMPKLCD